MQIVFKTYSQVVQHLCQNDSRTIPKRRAQVNEISRSGHPLTSTMRGSPWYTLAETFVDKFR